MTRDDFHKLFKSPGPVVLPVIHVLDSAQALRNVEKALAAGSAGVFLINHDFGVEHFVPIIRAVRVRFPSLWFGVNFLGVTGSAAFPVLGRLGRDGVCIDAYWADDARIDERRGAAEQADAEDIRRMRDRSAWQGLYFGGTAFKKQRAVAAGQYAEAARLAAQFMDVVCTSGAATGCAAEIGKIKTFRAAIGDRPLALASGITPGNARDYCADVDCFMVATGINDDGDFYNISAAKLTELLATTRDYGAHK